MLGISHKTMAPIHSYDAMFFSSTATHLCILRSMATIEWRCDDGDDDDDDDDDEI
jgi:hypothetical protein